MICPQVIRKIKHEEGGRWGFSDDRAVGRRKRRQTEGRGEVAGGGGRV